jgi:drug/metabolite transporter (DMT)-like permease
MMGAIVYVGVFASLSAFVLWNKAIATVGPSKAGMIYYTLPLFSGLLAHLFLKEDIHVHHFYCMLLILSGIVAANYASEKATPVKH